MGGGWGGGVPPLHSERGFQPRHLRRPRGTPFLFGARVFTTNHSAISFRTAAAAAVPPSFLASTHLVDVPSSPPAPLLGARARAWRLLLSIFRVTSAQRMPISSLSRIPSALPKHPYLARSARTLPSASPPPPTSAPPRAPLLRLPQALRHVPTRSARTSLSASPHLLQRLLVRLHIYGSAHRCAHSYTH